MIILALLAGLLILSLFASAGSPDYDRSPMWYLGSQYPWYMGSRAERRNLQVEDDERYWRRELALEAQIRRDEAAKARRARVSSFFAGILARLSRQESEEETAVA